MFIFRIPRHPSIWCYFVMGEVIICTNYYLFYRNLFEHIDDVSTVVAFMFFHVASEWLWYCTRTTEWYFDSTTQLCTEYMSPLAFKYLAKSDISFPRWQKFVSLELGIRVAVMACTWVMYVACYIFLRFGYNRSCFPAFSAKVTSGRFQKTMNFLCSTFAIEILNIFVMLRYFFAPRNIDISVLMYNISCNHWFRLWVVSISAALGLNLFVAAIK